MTIAAVQGGDISNEEEVRSLHNHNDRPTMSDNEVVNIFGHETHKLQLLHEREQDSVLMHTSLESTCTDSGSFTFVTNAGKVANCNWLSKGKKSQRRQKMYCKRGPIKGACLQTCARCECIDNKDYKFPLINFSEPTMRKCDWIIKHKKRIEIRRSNYCLEDDGVTATSHGNKCIKSCGFCSKVSTPSPMKTALPTSSPTLTYLLDEDDSSPTASPSSSCQDNNSFRFITYDEQGNMRERSCEWLTRRNENRRKGMYCFRKDILNNCQSTCYFCYREDTPNFRFQTKSGDTVGCDWLKQKWNYKKKYCFDNFIEGETLWKNATVSNIGIECRRSCNLLLGETDMPSQFQTLSPSISTNAPTELPSKSITPRPSKSPTTAPMLPTPKVPTQPSPQLTPSTNTPTHYMIPSKFPSALPSLQPSLLTSNEPSSLPSDIPSMSSDMPSMLPSSLPSESPSMSSDKPSMLPSSLPSESPSMSSDKPSMLPSLLPSEFPSSLPSDTPSGSPSFIPSLIPSSVPSSSPSDLPSLLVWNTITDIDGSAANHQSGFSLSLSSDASALAIGSPGFEDSTGYPGEVRVYSNENGSWDQKGLTFYGVSGHGFAISVSLSQDGNTLAIGSSYYNNYTGRAQVYTYNGSAWSQKGGDINGVNSDDRFGVSVALSSDGDTIAVGAWQHDNLTGNLRVFAYSGTWSQKGGDLNGSATGDRYGLKMDLSSDGNMIAIGSYLNDSGGNNSGHVQVFMYTAPSWIQMGSDIIGDVGDQSGTSISLSSDGLTVAIGSPSYGTANDFGRTRIFTYSAASWSQKGSDINGETSGDASGASVSLSSDGNTVAIGSKRNSENGSNSGHVRVYEYIDSSWKQKGTDLDGEAAEDTFGNTVSLSSDGNTLAVGGRYHDTTNGNDSGHVKIFEYGLV